MAQQAEAGDIGAAADASLDGGAAGGGVPAVIDATASCDTSPVAFIRLFSTPTPSGLVSDSAVPATAPAFVMTRSRSTRPVTAIPYFGSGSSIECPPPT